MNSEELRHLLQTKSSNKYRAFNQNVIPGARPSLGVTLPVLRTIAKEIAAREPLTFLKDNPLYYHEEALLYAFVLGYQKAPISAKFPYIDSFLPHVNDWAVCDGLVSTLKFKKNEKQEMWNFLLKHPNSLHPFSLRFVSVMYLSYFLEDEYIDHVISRIADLEGETYYSKMALAWLISVIMVKYPQKGIEVLRTINLSSWTVNKAIQKTKESFRVSEELKAVVNTLKRN